MADVAYKFTGVNTAQLANEVRLLRQNSSTFRALEAAAAAAGYTTIEIRMGAGLLKGDVADSGEINSTTWGLRINSDATGSWGVGGRQATVGEVIAHELAMPLFLATSKSQLTTISAKAAKKECGCGVRLAKWRSISDCPEQIMRTI